MRTPSSHVSSGIDGTLLSVADGYLYTHLPLQLVWVGTPRPSAFQVHAPVFEDGILRQRAAEYSVNIVPDGISAYHMRGSARG